MTRIRRSVFALAWVLLFPALGADAGAQSPYGLAARQTIPFVVSQASDELSQWSTEINVHNPGQLPITTRITFFGAVASATSGALACQPLVVPPGGTGQARLSALCPLNPGLNYGRLELTALNASAMTVDDPAADLFLANARIGGSPVEFLTVEGFPQGNLSGNKAYAAVTGLKSGLVDGSQWASFCFAAALNEATPVFLKLVDGSGSQVGPFGVQTALAPPAPQMQTWDAFAAVNAPPGNYDNDTALFSTAASGGQGGAGVFAFCEVLNMTTPQVTFSVAKYLDNNDAARQHRTTVSQNPYGKQFTVNAQSPKDISVNNRTNLHVAYFQHPDHVRCEVIFDPNPQIPYFDLGQMRLIDPDGKAVAGGPHMTFFEADLGEKSTVHNGQNGRWLIEVGPDRTIEKGSFYSHDTMQQRTYTLSCSSSNGHNQLEIAGHCYVACVTDPNDKKYAMCGFNPLKMGSFC